MDDKAPDYKRITSFSMLRDNSNATLEDKVDDGQLTRPLLKYKLRRRFQTIFMSAGQYCCTRQGLVI